MTTRRHGTPRGCDLAELIVVNFALPLATAAVAEWLLAWLDRELSRGPADADEGWWLVALVRPAGDGCLLRIAITDGEPEIADDPDVQRVQLALGAADARRLRAALARDLVTLWARARLDPAPIHPVGDDAPDPRGGVRGAHRAAPCPVGEDSPNGLHPSRLPSRPRDRDRWRETWQLLHARFGAEPTVAESAVFLKRHYDHLLVNRNVLARLIEAGVRGELKD